MASSPITSWQIDGETVTDFIFWGSKITADGYCSHEIKKDLLLGRKVTLTSWDIDGETVETVADFIFLAPKSLQMVTAAMKLKDTYSLEGKLCPS